MAQQVPGRLSVPNRHQLGHDAHRDLFRRDRANVEPYRRKHSIERRQVAPAGDALQDAQHLATAADQAQVAVG